MTDLTNHHSLGSLRQAYELTFLEARSLKSISLSQSQGFGKGHTPFQRLYGRISSFSCSLWWLVAVLSLRLYHPIFKAIFKSLCPSHKDTCDDIQDPPSPFARQEIAVPEDLSDSPRQTSRRSQT